MMGVYITERCARSALAAMAVACTSAGVAAERWQDLAALPPLAERFVQAQVRATPGRILVSVTAPESRLRLPACDQPAAFAPPSARYWGNGTVGVRCDGPRPWTLYLPVNVSVMGPVVVAARPIRKGETLGEADLAVREMDLTQMNAGGTDDPSEVLGRVAKGPLAGGSVVRVDVLSARPVVLAGESVRLAFAGDGFEIHALGQALTAGGIGENVEVKARSGRVLRGLVRDKGLVVVR